MKNLNFCLYEPESLFFCAFCQEEYILPDDIEGCPVCLCEDIEVVS